MTPLEFSLQTVGGRTAPSGTVVAQVAVMHGHNLLGDHHVQAI